MQPIERQAEPFRAPIRDDLAGLEPYGAPQLEVRHPLNVNENPFPPSPELAARLGEAVRAAAAGLNRYPDREFMPLRTALGEYLSRESGISAPPASSVWAANGSNEIMQHLFAAFGGKGRSALSFTPCYSMYPEYARNSFTEFITVPRSAAPEFALSTQQVEQACREHRPTLVLLTSPNNPTGTAIAMELVAAACKAQRAHNGLVVVDEAYAEFRRDGVPSALTLLSEYENLVVTRTMSKAFAMAGTRLGYAVAAPEIIDALRIVRLPYHLSAITQAAALTALESADELLAQVSFLRGERDRLVTHLRGRGYTVADSDANFVFFGTFPDRHAVWQGLLERSVLVREVGPDGWLRVSVGTAQDNAAFTAALEEVDPR
ncbi:histidinol-phosphate transaminase [Dermabacteraceae bacterium TAE3-ERU27]|nr:histidinol-phosphate transaminase [Dermabacteraceae bacterium TAE3-ERU27]